MTELIKASLFLVICSPLLAAATEGCDPNRLRKVPTMNGVVTYNADGQIFSPENSDALIVPLIAEKLSRKFPLNDHYFLVTSRSNPSPEGWKVYAEVYACKGANGNSYSKFCEYKEPLQSNIKTKEGTLITNKFNAQFMCIKDVISSLEK